MELQFTAPLDLTINPVTVQFDTEKLKVELWTDRIRIQALAPFTEALKVRLYGAQQTLKGQINVFPGEVYRVPIRIIALVREEQKATDLAHIQQKMAAINLPQLLTSGPFAQANIQFEPENDPQHPGRPILRTATYSCKQWQYVPKFNLEHCTFHCPQHAFRAIDHICEPHTRDFKGITLILSQLAVYQKRPEGRVSFPGITWKYFKTALLCKGGLNRDVLIHELGHSLGLTHSFCPVAGGNSFVFPQGSTRNFMDFRRNYSGPSHFTYFSVWQWNRMREWIVQHELNTLPLTVQ